MVIDAILTTVIIIIYAALGVSLGFLYKHINWAVKGIAPSTYHKWRE